LFLILKMLHFVKILAPLLVIFGIAIAKPSTTVSSEKESSADKNYEEGEYFEGDIDVLPEQLEFMAAANSKARSGLRNEYYRWPKTAGLVNVPYIFDAASGYSELRNFTIRIVITKFLPQQMPKEILSEVEWTQFKVKRAFVSSHALLRKITSKYYPAVAAVQFWVELEVNRIFH